VREAEEIATGCLRKRRKILNERDEDRTGQNQSKGGRSNLLTKFKGEENKVKGVKSKKKK
jgi:hypothetical protein